MVWRSSDRTLSSTIITALALLVMGAAFYIYAITTERNRADTSEADAKRKRKSAEASLNELKLKHSQLLLTTDPSAVLDTLNTYLGADIGRASQVYAEATGRGVARLRAKPHTDTTRWVE